MFWPKTTIPCNSRLVGPEQDYIQRIQQKWRRQIDSAQYKHKYTQLQTHKNSMNVVKLIEHKQLFNSQPMTRDTCNCFSSRTNSFMRLSASNSIPCSYHVNSQGKFNMPQNFCRAMPGSWWLPNRIQDQNFAVLFLHAHLHICIVTFGVRLRITGD